MDSASPQRRTALVTGASRGIGRAIAVALGSRGFNVAVNYFSSPDAAAETVKLVEQAGGRAVAIQADVGRDADRRRLVEETVKAFADTGEASGGGGGDPDLRSGTRSGPACGGSESGDVSFGGTSGGGIDVLVNNAGIPPSVRDDILDAGEDVYDRVMDTNLKGPFFLTQLVAKRMTGSGSSEDGQPANPDPGPRTPEPGPAIINIGSVSAYAASVTRSQYCIAKAGMRMMTQLFAARLAGEGIGVYEVCPGVIDTDMARGAKEKYDRLILEEGLLPIARWGSPDDVAKAVLAIVDGYLPYSTGSVIDVDGGYHIRRL